MQRPVLLVLALEQENHQRRLDQLAHRVLYTGVGKVNATLALSRYLASCSAMPLLAPQAATVPSLHKARL